MPRYYYDSKAKACKEFKYSGCGGNANNFVSEADCYNVCRKGEQFCSVTGREPNPTTTDSCSQPPLARLALTQVVAALWVWHCQRQRRDFLQGLVVIGLEGMD